MIIEEKVKDGAPVSFAEFWSLSILGSNEGNASTKASKGKSGVLVSWSCSNEGTQAG